MAGGFKSVRSFYNDDFSNHMTISNDHSLKVVFTHGTCSRRCGTTMHCAVILGLHRNLKSRCSHFLHRVQNTLHRGKLIRESDFLNQVQRCSCTVVQVIKIWIRGAGEGNLESAVHLHHGAEGENGRIRGARAPRCRGGRKLDLLYSCTAVQRTAKARSALQLCRGALEGKSRIGGAGLAKNGIRWSILPNNECHLIKIMEF